MASDTSLVFNLLGKDRISPILGVIKNAFRSAGETAEAAMDKAAVSTDRLDNQIQETERHLAELNAEFAATGDKTLFGKISRDRSLLSNLQRIRGEVESLNKNSNSSGGGLSSLFKDFGDAPGIAGKAATALSGLASWTQAVSEQAAKADGTVVEMLGTLASSSGPVGIAIAAAAALNGTIVGLVGAFLAVGPAVALAGGALGSVPALIGGGIAGIGALKLGLTGLSSEYHRLTTATGGGGGATKAQKDFTAATRAVQSAVEELARSERDVTTAQQEALASQQAITAARETASKRIRDESLSLQGAKLDQKDAAQAVVDAQNALNVAQASGNTGEIDKAQEAYERAVIAASEAKNKVDDLTEANRKNAKTGVEGSDEVVQAKKQEATARQRVADSIQAEHDAELRLADARKSLADQKAQGSASGGGGGGAGQQITQLAPAARAFLNTIIGLRPAFKDLRLDVQQKLFAGLAGPLQVLAQKWLPQLHSTLGAFAGTFNGIARTAFSTASRKSFIENMAIGADAVRKALGDVGKAVAGPLLDAFGRLARASAPFVQRLGGLLAGALATFSAWVKKADESGKLTAFFQGAASTLGKIWTLGGQVVGIIAKFVGIIYPQSKSASDGLLDGVNKALTKVSNWLDNPKHQQTIRNIVTDVEQLIAALWQAGVYGVRAFTAIVGAVKAVRSTVSGLWEPLKNGFRNAVNWIIGKWNNLHFTIGGGSFLGASIPSATFNTPDIPYLAKGGTATSSGMAIVGDDGPELISLQRGAQVTPLSQAGGRTVVEFDFRGIDGEFARLLMKTIRTKPGVRTTIAGHLKNA